MPDGTPAIGPTKIRHPPQNEGVFLGRHTSAKAMKAQKEAFTIGAVKVAVRRRDTTLAEIFVENYERSIDFGGHPKPNASFSASVLDKRDGESGMTVLAISDEPKIVEHALKCTSQVGLRALCVLQHVFKEKFELLGIRQEMSEAPEKLIPARRDDLIATLASR
jgi:hypothetical protein